MKLKTFITITTAAAIGTAGIAAPAFATPVLSSVWWGLS